MVRQGGGKSLKYEGAGLASVCGDGSRCLLFVVGLSSENSNGGGMMRERHLECDPTILGGGVGVDLRVD